MKRVPPAFRYLYLSLVFTGTALALEAGLQVVRASDRNASPSSVLETMDKLIDPAADALWASVGTEETAYGSHLHAPQNDTEWLKLASYAQSLVAGARRLQTPALPIGTNAHSRLADAESPGTRTAIQIRADIDADPAHFRAAALRLEQD